MIPGWGNNHILCWLAINGSMDVFVFYCSNFMHACDLETHPPLSETHVLFSTSWTPSRARSTMFESCFEGRLYHQAKLPLRKNRLLLRRYSYCCRA